MKTIYFSCTTLETVIIWFYCNNFDLMCMLLFAVVKTLMLRLIWVSVLLSGKVSHVSVQRFIIYLTNHCCVMVTSTWVLPYCREKWVIFESLHRLVKTYLFSFIVKLNMSQTWSECTPVSDTHRNRIQTGIGYKRSIVYWLTRKLQALVNHASYTHFDFGIVKMMHIRDPLFLR